MNSSISRRKFIAAGVGASLLPSVRAQVPWPSAGPIKLIVPFAAGGSTDGIARNISEELRSRIGQSIIIENRPGAGSTLGTGSVARAAPDGYTLLVSVISAFSVGSTLYRGRIDWEVDKSFVHVGDILRTPYALMANKNAPFNTVAELIAHAKRTGPISVGTSGVGSIPHLVMLRLGRAAGVEFIHIPYKGGAPAVTDAIGGTIPLVMDGLAAAVPNLRSGALKGLALTSAARSPNLPDIATFAEAGYRDVTVEGWAGIAAPAGTPRVVTDRLAAALKEVMALPALQERYRAASSAPGRLSPDEMQKFVRDEALAWAPIVAASGATVD